MSSALLRQSHNYLKHLWVRTSNSTTLLRRSTACRLETSNGESFSRRTSCNGNSFTKDNQTRDNDSKYLDYVNDTAFRKNSNFNRSRDNFVNPSLVSFQNYQRHQPLSSVLTFQNLRHSASQLCTPLTSLATIQCRPLSTVSVPQGERIFPRKAKKPKKREKRVETTYKKKKTLKMHRDIVEARKERKAKKRDRSHHLRRHIRPGIFYYVNKSYGKSKRIWNKAKVKKPVEIFEPSRISKGGKVIRIEPMQTTSSMRHHLMANSHHDQQKANTFENLGLHEDVRIGVNKLNVELPTLLQMNVIPRILAGENLFCAGQTGSGKTIGYAAPIINMIKRDRDLGIVPRHGRPQAVILSPTKELSSQILGVIRAIGSTCNVKSVGIVGKKEGLKRKLYQEFDILVGSPDAILTMLKRDWTSLRDTQWLVLDEADTLFDDGFKQSIGKIFEIAKLSTANAVKAGDDRYEVLEESNTEQNPIQYIMAAATVPKKGLLDLCKENIPNMQFSSTKLHQMVPHVRQTFVKTTQPDKPDQLLAHMKEFLKMDPSSTKPSKPVKKHATVEQIEFSNDPSSKMIVFTNKSSSCIYVKKLCEENGIKQACLHGGMMAEARFYQFDKFLSSKETRVLVCTDVASRGLDFSEVSTVINFDCPLTPTDYVHRAGRTGRALQTHNSDVPNVITYITQNKEVAFAQRVERSAQKFEELEISDMRDLKDKHAMEQMEMKRKENKKMLEMEDQLMDEEEDEEMDGRYNDKRDDVDEISKIEMLKARNSFRRPAPFDEFGEEDDEDVDTDLDTLLDGIGDDVDRDGDYDHDNHYGRQSIDVKSFEVGRNTESYEVNEQRAANVTDVNESISDVSSGEKSGRRGRGRRGRR